MLKLPHSPHVPSALPELSHEDIMEDSAKSLPEVQVDNTYYSSLIYPTSCPTIEGNLVG